MQIRKSFFKVTVKENISQDGKRKVEGRGQCKWKTQSGVWTEQRFSKLQFRILGNAKVVFSLVFLTQTIMLQNCLIRFL